ncbi:MAG: carbon-nitrogen hydrolase family protein, partial [Oscillospiraceae bacterium]|nr:carbon-nitrogen hydrolase family protein [Oscillospiraceae bacterium]
MIKLAIIHSGYVKPPEDYYDSEMFVSEKNAVTLVNANLEKTVKMLAQAGESRADIAVTSEDFLDIGRHIRAVDQPELFGWLVAETENRITDELCEIARKNKMLIAANEYETDGGKVFNTTKLIGRDGAIIYRYKKVHIPSGERFLVHPGGEKPEVIKTDIGNIGFATCYDIIFPEHCRILALDGADIIIHQTQGWGTGAKSSIETGEAFMRVRAAENSVYLAVAKNVFN